MNSNYFTLDQQNIIKRIEDSIDEENFLKEAVLDDEIVINFIIIAENLKEKNTNEQLQAIKWVENEYYDLRESSLADFLDDYLWLLLNCQDWDELHNYIRELVYESELNLNLLLKVSEDLKENLLN